MAREHIGIPNASAGTANDNVHGAAGGDTEHNPKAGGTVAPTSMNDAGGDVCGAGKANADEIKSPERGTSKIDDGDTVTSTALKMNCNVTNVRGNTAGITISAGKLFNHDDD